MAQCVTIVTLVFSGTANCGTGTRYMRIGFGQRFSACCRKNIINVKRKVSFNLGNSGKCVCPYFKVFFLVSDNVFSQIFCNFLKADETNKCL